MNKKHIRIMIMASSCLVILGFVYMDRCRRRSDPKYQTDHIERILLREEVISKRKSKADRLVTGEA